MLTARNVGHADQHNSSADDPDAAAAAAGTAAAPASIPTPAVVAMEPELLVGIQVDPTKGMQQNLASRKGLKRVEDMLWWKRFSPNSSARPCAGSPIER